MIPGRRNEEFFRGNKGSLRIPSLSFQHLKKAEARRKTPFVSISLADSNPIGSTRIVIRPLILAKRILIIAALVLGLLFCGDYVYVRIRMLHPKPDDPFESLKTLRLLAIPEKGGRTSYEIDQQNPEQTITCVHSLFPHAGYSPCWYVKPRINQPIPMTIIQVSMDRLEGID